MTSCMASRTRESVAICQDEFFVEMAGLEANLALFSALASF